MRSSFPLANAGVEKPSVMENRPDMDGFQVRRAVRHLRRGGVVAHATEGVWGLACNPFDRNAVGRILALKGRSPKKGLIVIGASADCFAQELQFLPVADRRMVEASWPGAVSWILPNRRFPAWIVGSGGGVAARVPGDAQARRLCAGFGGPLVSTSANPSGHPATADVLRVRLWFQGRIDYLLPGRTQGRQGPSQLRTLAGDVLR